MATDVQIVRATYDVLVDYSNKKKTAHQALMEIARAVILRDVSR